MSESRITSCVACGWADERGYEADCDCFTCAAMSAHHLDHHNQRPQRKAMKRALWLAIPLLAALLILTIIQDIQTDLGVAPGDGGRTARRVVRVLTSAGAEGAWSRAARLSEIEVCGGVVAAFKVAALCEGRGRRTTGEWRACDFRESCPSLAL